jgi:adenine-specific DNA-methyltransferase
MLPRPAHPAMERKARGCLFHAPLIAELLSRWAIRSVDARVLDPTCGEAVFLLAATSRPKALGAHPETITTQLIGVDLHQASVDASGFLLAATDAGASLVSSELFELPTPAHLDDRTGWQDAMIGNPPLVRYREHRGHVRARSAAAALAQGVRPSGLASSWAATLVHASSFLAPSGRLAMRYEPLRESSRR